MTELANPTPEFVKVRRGNVHIVRWPYAQGVRTVCGKWHPFDKLAPATGEESEKCLACWMERLPRDPCPKCGGDGEIVVEFVFGMQVQDCVVCDGSGVVGE